MRDTRLPVGFVSYSRSVGAQRLHGIDAGGAPSGEEGSDGSNRQKQSANPEHRCGIAGLHTVDQLGDLSAECNPGDGAERDAHRDRTGALPHHVLQHVPRAGA